MTVLLRRLWRDESANAAIEYALLAVLISVSSITAIGPVGVALNTMFADIAVALARPL